MSAYAAEPAPDAARFPALRFPLFLFIIYLLVLAGPKAQSIVRIFLRISGSSLPLLLLPFRLRHYFG